MGGPVAVKSSFRSFGIKTIRPEVLSLVPRNVSHPHIVHNHLRTGILSLLLHALEQVTHFLALALAAAVRAELFL